MCALPAVSRSRDVVRWTGAERVELSERFYRALFAAALVCVALAGLTALALLPLRAAVGMAAAPTMALTGLLAVGGLLAVPRASAVYTLLRRNRWGERACVLASAALVSYPLASQLWWPACALLMLVSILAPHGRTLAYCLLVLIANLLAHLVTGDLPQTPVVHVVGLWVGLIFWPLAFGLTADRLASHLLRLRAQPDAPEALEPLRVGAVQHAEPAPSAPSSADPVLAPTLECLTLRQLQVVALLADGMPYAAIAARLSIGVGQVQRHVSGAVRRAGARNRTDLVVTAVREGLTAAPASDRASEDARPRADARG